MIRSRDLVIFVCVLLFLCLGILITHLKATYFPLFLGSPVVFNLEANAPTTFVAIAPSKTNNRASTIERLKNALALNTEVIRVNPSVETDTALTATETSEEQDDTSVVDTNARILSCGTTDDSLALMSEWPRSAVRIEVKDGMRMIVHRDEKTALVLFATSTASTSEIIQNEPVVTTLLEMEMYPRVQGTSACVPSTIIGVTSLGALLSNSDASFYKNTASDVLIGYARDGFPVYGVYEGIVDDCGGYMHGEGYRYTIRKDRNFVLGCFVAVPKSFNL